MKCRFKKAFTKEVISVASSLALLPKNNSWMVSDNWFVVREESGDYYYPDELQRLSLTCFM